MAKTAGMCSRLIEWVGFSFTQSETVLSLGLYKQTIEPSSSLCGRPLSIRPAKKHTLDQAVLEGMDVDIIV